MARFKVTHSEDACTINIEGDPRTPEPSTAIIKFPGGHVEVARCSDGSYWAHLRRDSGVQREEGFRVADSRVDYNFEGSQDWGIPKIEDQEKVEGLSVRIARDWSRNEKAAS